MSIQSQQNISLGNQPQQNNVQTTNEDQLLLTFIQKSNSGGQSHNRNDQSEYNYFNVLNQFEQEQDLEQNYFEPTFNFEGLNMQFQNNLQKKQSSNQSSSSNNNNNLFHHKFNFKKSSFSDNIPQDQDQFFQLTLSKNIFFQTEFNHINLDFSKKNYSNHQQDQQLSSMINNSCNQIYENVQIKLPTHSNDYKSQQIQKSIEKKDARIEFESQNNNDQNIFKLIEQKNEESHFSFKNNNNKVVQAPNKSRINNSLCHKNYTKNICNNITKVALQCFIDGKYKHAIIEQHCNGDEELYYNSVKFFKTQFKYTLGIKYLNDLIAVYNNKNHEQLTIYKVFLHFLKWFLAERAARYIFNGKMKDQTQYLRFKNKVMAKLFKTINNMNSTIG